MGEIITKSCFSSQSEPHTAKLCFSVVLKHFCGYSQKSSLFSQKSDYVRKEHWNTQKVCFIKCLKGLNPDENLDCLNNCFLSKQLKGTNINKNWVFHQIEPHTANLCFSVVSKHFWGNSQRTCLFSPKSNYLRKEHWNTPKVCFS